MWILTSKKTGEIYYLHRDKERHTIGRMNTDLILKNDESISRQHACITPEDDHIKVTDLASKYGTFCNHNIENLIPISKNSPVILKNGERVRFGRFTNEWIVSKLNISTMMSTLKKEEKIKVHQSMTFLQGNIIENWLESCTHLTMNEITLTLKALQALVAGIPIVSVEFWETFVENLKKGKEPPNCKDYLPKLAEISLPKKDFFNPIESRKVIFKEKYFVFLEEKNFEKYDTIISKAGGESICLSDKFEISRLSKKNVVVIQSIVQQTQNLSSISIVLDYLKRIGRRLVPDVEIGLAIIYCSTEKYCNPDYDLMTEIIPSTLGSLSNVDVRARDTQDIISHISDSTSGKSLFNPAEVEQSDSSDEITLSVTQEPQRKNIFNVDDDIVGPSDDEESNILVRGTMRNMLASQGKRKRGLQSSDSNESKRIHLTQSTNNAASQSIYIPETIATGLSTIEKNPVSNLSASNNTVRKSKRGYETDDSDEIISSLPSKRKKDLNSLINENEKDIFHEDNDEVTIPETAQSKKETTVRNVSRSLRSQPEILKIPEEMITENSNSVSCGNTEPFIPSQDQHSNVEICAENKLEPTGWLVKSISRIDIENDQNESSSGNIDNNKSSSWINSIRGAFEVQVKDMSLSSRVNRDDQISLNESNITKNYIGKKNFKAFVKKNNYKPQKVVVPTVPVTINNA